MSDLYDEYVLPDGNLTTVGISHVSVALEILGRACFRNSDAHGWYEELWRGTDQNPKASLAQRNFGEVIALIHSEITEALESHRNHEPALWYKHKQPEVDSSSAYNADGVIGKAEGIAAEFADAIIRIMDYCGAYDIPIAEALINKHLYNFGRPYRHGGKAC